MPEKCGPGVWRSGWFGTLQFRPNDKNYNDMNSGPDPIKILQRKVYASPFLSILIGWKMWEANQNAWKIEERKIYPVKSL